MVQAARSGKQNIAEGSSVSGTSKGTELRLIGVARASLEELLNDSQDFLRQRGLVSWTKEEDKAVYIRRLAYRQPRSYSTYQKYVEDKSAETSANSMVCLINQTCFLLDRLKKQLGAQLIEEGGIRERIYRQRRTHRGF
jgi:restriction system protein